MGKDDGYKEVVFIAQVVLKELAHRCIISSGDYERGCNFTELRCKDTVDCPGDWWGPVVPPPPHRDELQVFELR